MEELNFLKQIDVPFLIPADVAPILGVDPQAIRNQAHEDPSQLGFPVCVIGTRIKIPRIPFLQFVEGMERGVSEATGT